MKRLLITLLLSLFAVGGCGGITDVGNPTGTVFLTGQLDVSGVEAAVSEFESKEVASAQIDFSQLIVLATDENSEEFVTDVEQSGYFIIELRKNHVYSMFVYQGELLLGPFSFEQNDQGERANRLFISNARPDGEIIDMGLVRYRNGAFEPQNEPRRQMGSSQF